MGGPDSEGVVEIGDGTLEGFRGRGYATEAARALADYALSQSGVTRVIAHALPENRASVRVLKKCGFVETGAGREAGTRRFEYVPRESGGCEQHA